MKNSKYIVQYDYYDDDFGTATFKADAKDYEEAKEIVEDLKHNDLYGNFEIINCEPE